GGQRRKGHRPDAVHHRFRRRRTHRLDGRGQRRRSGLPPGGRRRRGGGAGRRYVGLRLNGFQRRDDAGGQRTLAFQLGAEGGGAGGGVEVARRGQQRQLFEGGVPLAYLAPQVVRQAAGALAQGARQLPADR